MNKIKSQLLSTTSIKISDKMIKQTAIPFTQNGITYGGYAVNSKFINGRWVNQNTRIHTIDGWKDE